MWSTVSQQNHIVFKEGDTNMLLEAYVITHFKLFYLYIYILML